MKFRANFISLKDASTYCDYSPDYLNLLVRKGLLKALKIGRNWVTTKEWLSDYLNCVEQKQAKAAVSGKIATILVAKPVASGNGDEKEKAIKGIKIENEAVKEIFADRGSQVLTGEVLDCRNLMPVPVPKNNNVCGIRVAKSNSIKTGVAVAALSLVCFAAITMGMQNKTLFFSTGELSVSAQAGLWQAGQYFGNIMAKLPQEILTATDSLRLKIAGAIDYTLHGKTEVVAVVEKKFPVITVEKEILELSANNLQQNIINDTQTRMDDFRNELGLPILAKSPASSDVSSNGVVVLPSSGDKKNDQEIQDKIKMNFSDEVAVKATDGISGVIIPEFKNKSGQPYIYMMVPAKGIN